MGRHRRPWRARARLLVISAVLTVSGAALGAGAAVLLPGGSADDQAGTASWTRTSAGVESGAATGRATDGGDRHAGSPTGDPEGTTGSPDGDRKRGHQGEGGSPESATASSSRPPATTEATTPQTRSSSPGAASSPTSSRETAAARQVLTLVNDERAAAGCQPLVRDGALAELASDFSRDMAERGFFSHTDPDGRSPWDRAEDAGITNLAAENIARGQADAQAVMDAWMASAGHRANILNCDYRTLGVGVHFGEGGPWWTQDFGY